MASSSFDQMDTVHISQNIQDIDFIMSVKANTQQRKRTLNNDVHIVHIIEDPEPTSLRPSKQPKLEVGLP